MSHPSRTAEVQTPSVLSDRALRTAESLARACSQRDALLVSIRNLVTSVKSQHNLPEALMWAESAIVGVAAAIAIEEAAR